MTEISLHLGDCLEVMREMADDSIDAVVTDPPYGLSKEPDIVEVLTHWLAGDEYKHNGGGFMGRSWDSFVPGPEYWREVYRVMKPGAHILAFGGTRTVDLLTIALRIAGFEIRDSVHWVQGAGFPKSLDVSKAIDKAAGMERIDAIKGGHIGISERGGDGRNGHEYATTVPHIINKGSLSRGVPSTDAAQQWAGWGSALKPAHEPIVLARKPLRESTIAAQVLATGTGALNIDATRVGTDVITTNGWRCGGESVYGGGNGIPADGYRGAAHQGRWPANLVLSHSPGCVRRGVDDFACVDGCAVAALDAMSGERPTGRITHCGNNGSTFVAHARRYPATFQAGDTGGASRFYYRADWQHEIEERLEAALPFLYQPKAARCERDQGLPEGQHSNHPTVKPVALCKWLVRLITPPNGTILDPFLGSGTTGIAAVLEGFNFVGIELDAEYLEIARLRIAYAEGKMQEARQLELLTV